MTPDIGEVQIFHDYQRRKINATTNLTGIYPPHSYIIYPLDTILTPTRLETVKCGTDNFVYKNKTEVKFKSVDQMLCIKDKSYLRSGGAFLSDVYEYLRIYLVPCVNSTDKNYTCATPEQ
jgi:hypothetical protein